MASGIGSFDPKVLPLAPAGFCFTISGKAIWTGKQKANPFPSSGAEALRLKNGENDIVLAMLIEAATIEDVPPISVGFRS